MFDDNCLLFPLIFLLVGSYSLISYKSWKLVLLLLLFRIFTLALWWLLLLFIYFCSSWLSIIRPWTIMHLSVQLINVARISWTEWYDRESMFGPAAILDILLDCSSKNLCIANGYIYHRPFIFENPIIHIFVCFEYFFVWDCPTVPSQTYIFSFSCSLLFETSFSAYCCCLIPNLKLAEHNEVYPVQAGLPLAFAHTWLYSISFSFFIRVSENFHVMLFLSFCRFCSMVPPKI